MPSAVPSSGPTTCQQNDVIPVTDCDQTFRASDVVLVLNTDLTCEERSNGEDEFGIRILGSRVTLDCQGNQFEFFDGSTTDNGLNDGIIIGGVDVKVINCDITNFRNGIRGNSNHDNAYIENVDSFGNTRGGVFSEFNSLTIFNSQFRDNGSGLFLNGEDGASVLPQATISSTEIVNNARFGLLVGDNDGTGSQGDVGATLINSNADRNGQVNAPREGIEVLPGSTVVLHGSSACENNGNDIQNGGTFVAVESSCDNIDDCCPCVVGPNPPPPATCMPVTSFTAPSVDLSGNECSQITGDIDTDNTYVYLSANLDCVNPGGEHGVRVNADGVTVDCRGNSITGNEDPINAPTFRGIRIDGDAANVNVINCDVSGFDTGVYAFAPDGGVYIEDLTATGNRDGVAIARNGGVITQSTLERNSRHGILLEGGTASITNTQINDNDTSGIRLRNGATANVYDATITGNRNGILGSGDDMAGSGADSLTIQSSTVCGNDVLDIEDDFTGRLEGTATQCSGEVGFCCGCPTRT